MAEPPDEFMTVAEVAAVLKLNPADRLAGNVRIVRQTRVVELAGGLG
jgi:hypothetical protein